MSDDDLIRRGDATAIVEIGPVWAREALAALPAVTMRVKPLAWYRPDGVHHTVTVEHAKAFGFTYCAYGGGAWGMEAPHYQHNLSEGNRTLEAAKAAAQADYEARILAALEPVTQPAPDAAAMTPEVQALVEAAERSRDGLLTTWAESRERHLAAEAALAAERETVARLEAALRLRSERRLKRCALTWQRRKERSDQRF